MKKLLFTLLLLPSMPFAAPLAVPLTIKFDRTLPVSRSTSINKPGCETSALGYTFDVTMLGWNLATSTCKATNLFPNLGYLTTGQRAARSNGQMWMTPTAVGSTFSLLGFKIKNYSLTNTLYLDTTTIVDGAEVTTTITIPASITSVTFDPAAPEFANLTGLSIRSTNNRFDITNIVTQ